MMHKCAHVHMRAHARKHARTHARTHAHSTLVASRTQQEAGAVFCCVVRHCCFCRVEGITSAAVSVQLDRRLDALHLMCMYIDR